MSIYADWRGDKPAIGISALTLVATLAVPFLSSAMAGRPWWENLLIGAGIFVIGGTIALSRLRVARGVAFASEPPAENEQEEQAERTAGDRRPTARWEIVEDSIRKAPIVTGEGPTILIGYARVDVVGDEQYHKLYYCKLHDVRDGHSYFEYRVEAPWGKLLKRESEVRLLPGEVIHSRRSWSAEDTGNPNVLADWKGKIEDARGLVKGSDKMVFVWTDTIQYEDGRVEKQTHRIVAPVSGLEDIENRFWEAGSSVAMGPSPF